MLTTPAHCPLRRDVCLIQYFFNPPSFIPPPFHTVLSDHEEKALRKKGAYYSLVDVFTWNNT